MHPGGTVPPFKMHPRGTINFNIIFLSLDLDLIAKMIDRSLRPFYNLSPLSFISLLPPPFQVGHSVGLILNENKCHLLTFSLVANQTKWHLVWNFPN